MGDLLTDSEFEQFRKLIYKESGISFSDTNRSILDSRLHDRLRKTGLATIKEYYDKLQNDEE
ncbi:MAG: protein-glutamate O-methyltransferase CheR, partial [Spirochaetaceae bacterium]|nr:protein-glutamate O-methyltransferase CheR [Spirochaetaceae bacterium]